MTDPSADDPASADPAPETTFQTEIDRIRAYLTPLSIIVGVQLSMVFYFVEEGWKGVEVFFPLIGMTCAGLALLYAVMFGISLPMEVEQRRRKPSDPAHARKWIGRLTEWSIVFFLLAFGVFLVKHWLL